MALCRCYGVRPFRYVRQRRQTLVVKPTEFTQPHAPEFQPWNAALSAYLMEVADKLTRKELHGETAEAEEIADPRALPG
jgi:hypothetical protein